MTTSISLHPIAADEQSTCLQNKGVGNVCMRRSPVEVGERSLLRAGLSGGPDISILFQAFFQVCCFELQGNAQ